MTLTLILIRHCKSDWHAGIASDHARPLNARGYRAAPRIGHFLKSHGLIPSEVLCSDARRTQETWAGIASQLPEAPAPSLHHGLYHAAPSEILALLRQATSGTVAVIGHNPGIGGLAWTLADDPPAHDKFGLYPTGATTALRFDVERWADISQGSVLHFTTPRDLPDPA